MLSNGWFSISQETGAHLDERSRRTHTHHAMNPEKGHKRLSPTHLAAGMLGGASYLSPVGPSHAAPSSAAVGAPRSCISKRDAIMEMKRALLDFPMSAALEASVNEELATLDNMREALEYFSAIRASYRAPMTSLAPGSQK